GQIDRAEMRDGPGLYQRVEIVFEYRFAVVILDVEVPARVIRAIAVALFEHGQGRVTVVHELAIVAERDTGAAAIVPDESVRRVGDWPVPVEIIFSSPAAVIRGPGFFGEIGGIACHRPVVPVGADLGIHIKIIEEYEIPDDR